MYLTSFRAKSFAIIDRQMPFLSISALYRYINNTNMAIVLVFRNLCDNISFILFGM
jgi:hypothetical protein